MNILVIGSGGREHAIAWKFSQSDKVNKVFVAPGNPGMQDCAEMVKFAGKEDIVRFSQEQKIEFVFIGPEQPLADGLADFLEAKNIKVVGPSAKAAQIEASKDFAKNLMKKYNVPSAEFQSFDDYLKAKIYLEECDSPIVIKADGLAAGKGVVIAQNKSEAEEALKNMMQDLAFSEAGNKVVIEEFMQGWEASIFAFSDGDNFISTIFSQDHKQAFDGDKGPNTGGMGAFAPVKQAEKYKSEVDEKIFAPIINGMKKEGIPYKGVLYAGLMITDQGPKVVEFNCRFGDPETQVILSLLKTDLVDISQAIINNDIDKIELEWKDNFAVDVIAASEGYPGKYEKGKKIEIDYPLSDSSKICFAGVKKENDCLLTNGGRVLAITTLGGTLEDAISSAYSDLRKILFTGMTYRTDIGKRKI